MASKLGWRYFETNEIGRNSLQIHTNCQKGTGQKRLKNWTIFENLNEKKSDFCPVLNPEPSWWLARALTIGFVANRYTKLWKTSENLILSQGLSYLYKNPTVLTYTYRSHQPRLGISSNNNNNNNTYLFDEDPGIMSEVETSSTRFRKPSRGENHRPPPAASSGAATLYATKQPRTSIKNNSHSSSHSSGGNNSSYSLYYEADDPGIMSEAETASTTRGKRSSSRNNSIPSNYKSSQRYILWCLVNYLFRVCIFAL